MTKTHKHNNCSNHDVSGCNEITCRAKALGMSVAKYNAWIVVPASMTLNPYRKSH